jgi:serine/threonine protein kinase
VGKECPSPAALEAMALGAGPEPGSRTHVSRCEACRTAIEEIRANQAFLGLAGTALADAADSVRAAVPRPAPAPDSVRGFTLLEEISRGGQGVVYRAVQIATKRPAAVKMLLGGVFASERQCQRFEREIEIAARLRHPNIVSVFESGLTADGTPYVAMEYVEGVALDRYAESKLGYPGKSDRARVDAVMRLVLQIASGVGHAHTAGVIHRDLKPSNILVDGSGNARVLDFGLARATDRAHDVSTTREFVGTPAYASPEQLGGDPASVNARTDVYALGLVLYRLLTHRHPYPCDGSLAELARHAIGTEPTPPSRHLTRLPSDVETIVLKCLAKDPARRYANASALASDIDDYLNGRPISARRDSTMYVLQRLALKHRVPALAVVAVAITLIVATVGLALLARDLDQARREAETSLAESNVQRARLLATAGNPEQAERLIWSNRFGAAPIAEEAALFAGSPDSIRDTWTLAEIYAFSPCVLRVEPGRRFFAVGFLPDQRSFWAIDGEGARWTWSHTGELIARTRPVCPEIQIDEAITCHDGRTVLVVRRESLELFDVDDPASRRVLQTPATQRYWHLDPLAQLIASTDRVTEGEIDVHRASDLTPIDRIPVRASSLMWAMNGGEPVLLVAVMADNDPRIEMRVPNEWQVARTLRPVEGVPAAHLPPFRNMILSPDGATLVTSVNEGLYLADARDGGDAATRLMLSRGHFHTVRYSPSGQLLYTLSMDGVLGLASPAETRILRNVVTGCSPRVADFSEQSMTALIAPTTGGILQYRLDDRQWLRRMPTSDLTTSCVDISINGDVAWEMIEARSGSFRAARRAERSRSWRTTRTAATARASTHCASHRTARVSSPRA